MGTITAKLLTPPCKLCPAIFHGVINPHLKPIADLLSRASRTKHFETLGSPLFNFRFLVVGPAALTRSSCKMSFAIEVPGEAAPLSMFELGRALEAAATSTDNAQRKSAGQQLQAWEAHPDYYTSLQARHYYLYSLVLLLFIL